MQNACCSIFLVSVLCLSRLVHSFCAAMVRSVTFNISSKFQCLSFVFISNKPTCFYGNVETERKETK